MVESNRLRVVLSVVDSHTEKDDTVLNLQDVDKNLLEAALDYAKRNGLGYFLLDKVKTLDLRLTQKNELELQREKRRIAAVRRTLDLLNKISERLRIDYVTIKTPYMIPHVPRDVDIFVLDAVREDMLGSLQESGMRFEHSSAVETTLRKDGYAKVDVYSRIVYFGFEFLDDDFFLESVTHRPLFDVRSPVLEERASFVLELLHSLFGHRSMTLLDFLNMELLMESIGNVETSRNIALRYGWVGAFDKALCNFNAIRSKSRSTDEVVTFPFLFDREFVLDCLSTIDGHSLSAAQKALINISLLVDGIVLRSEDSGLYQALKANDTVRRVANSVAHSIRAVRGDRKTT